MALVRDSGPIAVSGGNYWPLAVPLACIALWWPILAIVFNAHVATMFLIIASCLVVIVLASAALADALGLQDGLLHIDEDRLPPFDEADDSREPSR